eukprot:maker-scaffold412_size179788-snap-gene-0.18 protein:Tk11832 transcript:maker-scaffold412_size179788-snap-gene-0.18-mRNA-1 annotation:"hypothetical protein AUEXF2481DRAFT_27894"
MVIPGVTKKNELMPLNVGGNIIAESPTLTLLGVQCQSNFKWDSLQNLFYLTALVFMGMSLLQRDPSSSKIQLDGESFHDMHSNRLPDNQPFGSSGPRGDLPKLPRAWKADVIWSPINQGHLIPGTISLSADLIRFTFEFPSAEDGRPSIDLWQSRKEWTGDLLAFAPNQTMVFGCPRAFAQPTPAVVLDKQGAEFAGTKEFLDPWSQTQKTVKVWRAKGSPVAKSGNLYEFYEESDRPFRFDFVEEDETWCLSQSFASIHFRNVEELSTFELNHLGEMFQNRMDESSERSVNGTLLEVFGRYNGQQSTSTHHAPTGLEFLGQEESEALRVPSWPDHLYMEGGFTSNAGQIFRTTVHYSWPNKMIHTQLDHPTLGHTITQTANTTFIRFGAGKCFVLHGLGLPMPTWSSTLCQNLFYLTALVFMGMSLLQRDPSSSKIQLDGESFHDMHSNRLPDNQPFGSSGPRGDLPKLPRAWKADVIWSPINQGHLIPGTISLSADLIRFTFEFPSAEDGRPSIDLWQSRKEWTGDLLAFAPNQTMVFGCPRAFAQPTPAVVLDKQGAEFAGTKEFLDPWSQTQKTVKVWRAKGSPVAKSGNLYEFYEESDRPFRFDFVEEDETWCLSQSFASIHFRNVEELSTFELNHLGEMFQNRMDESSERSVNGTLLEVFGRYNGQQSTSTHHAPTGLEFLGQEESEALRVPSWPDHLYMEGGFTSNAGQIFRTTVHYSWPNKMIHTQLDHPTLGHTITQTANTTFIRFGAGKCFVLHGLGLPMPTWSSTLCQVRARYQNVHMAVCAFAPGRHLHYWYIPSAQSEIGYYPVQFLESRAPFREGASLAVADYTEARILRDFKPEILFKISEDCFNQNDIEGSELVFDVLSKDHAEYMMKAHHTSRHQ